MPERPRDTLLVLLEVGLCAVVLAAPLPFASVGRGGRLLLEISGTALGALWAVRAALRGVRLPPRPALLGAVGLLLLCVLQILPVGKTVFAAVSPRGAAIRDGVQPEGLALAAESRVLGVSPESLDPEPTLSLAPEATAGALRLGVALCVFLLVATTVAAERGLSGVLLALLVSAAFQALYGTLVLASGHPTIWNVPKRYYVDCATGTFVNRNHFAGFLAAALPGGVALARRRLLELPRAAGRQRLLALFGPQGVRALGLTLLTLVGLAGLLLSFSRAGIALGLGSVGITWLVTGRGRLGRRIVLPLLVLALALVPLAQIGSERLADRYARAAEDFTSEGGRAMVWRDTLEMVAAFPWTGAGFGSFAAVYPLFRSQGVRLLYEHAHNDLLQLAAEGGLVGVLLLALLLASLVPRLLASLRGSSPTRAGAAAGLSALLLHALVDFNFHIPANAAVAAVLAGLVLALPRGVAGTVAEG
jgi:putative inorganic carbon (HCO3(-)) transporter